MHRLQPTASRPRFFVRPLLSPACWDHSAPRLGALPSALVVTYLHRRAIDSPRHPPARVQGRQTARGRRPSNEHICLPTLTHATAPLTTTWPDADARIQCMQAFRRIHSRARPDHTAGSHRRLCRTHRTAPRSIQPTCRLEARTPQSPCRSPTFPLLTRLLPLSSSSSPGPISALPRPSAQRLCIPFLASCPLAPTRFSNA
ncbi:hypothetical protein BD413DRAFT_284999 [Trametes elegans]|nr:hypothetical protein BD413DRAFT_284999 [Trametes elegans]